MYWPDVVDLREFYASPLGVVTARMLRQKVRTLWPELGKDTLVGIGYAQPLLSLWKHNGSEEGCAVAFMPSGLGAMYWPSGSTNRAALTECAPLPLRDQQCNRIVIMHALEHAEPVRDLLREAWRALVPGGQLLLVVPNRRGIWARQPHTPFSNGRPYSMMQLRRLVSDEKFTLIGSETALHFIPSKRRWVLKLAPWLEKMWDMVMPHFGGVVMLQAEKQIYALLKEPTLSVKPSPLYAPATNALPKN